MSKSSLLAKLTASASQSSTLSAAKPLTSSNDPLTWTATLSRQENLCGVSSPHVIVSCPLSAEKISKGCICRVRAGSASPFLISILPENVKQQTTATVASIALCQRLVESVGIPKDVREVTIEEVIDPISLAQNTLSDLVISVKDLYVSKRDLWMFQIRLLGSVVFKSLSPPFADMLKCSSVSVENFGESFSLMSGIVGPQTRIVVRSCSAQLVVFLTITRDLWEIHPQTKQPKYVKLISAFFEGIKKSKDLARHHHLLLIATLRLDPQEVDYYEVLYEGKIGNFKMDEMKSNMISFFNFFPSRIKWVDCPLSQDDESNTGQCPDWFLSSSSSSSHHSSSGFVRDSAVCGCKTRTAPRFPRGGVPCHSANSNILECVNLALNHFGKHHMDRRLDVTGTQITVISSNNGVVEISDRSLIDITRKRAETTSCSIRVISVGQKPIANDSPFCAILSGGKKECLKLPWLWYSYYTSDFLGPMVKDWLESGVDNFANLVKIQGDKKIEIFSSSVSRGVLKPPANMQTINSYSPSAISGEKIFRKPVHAREKRTDSEILDLGLTTPRLQRVAIEASVKSSDIKPVDNWTVPGEDLKTFHDLIGTRLAMDMQIIDASGTSPDSPEAVGTDTSREKLSTSFGVLVSRTSMRETHIQKVMIKSEDKCVWMLTRLESGNIYVSRVTIGGESGNALTTMTTKPAPPISSEIADEYVYEYVLSRAAHKNYSSLSPLVSDFIVCKHCQDVVDSTSLEKRKFFIPPPLPWNLLDDIIVNPYMQQSLVSTVPNNSVIPQELVGIRWKFRSAIRTGLFALIPKESEFTHSITSSSPLGLGSTETLTSPVSGSLVNSRFLDWTRKFEKYINCPLPVTVGQQRKSSNGSFVSTLVRTGAGGEWYTLHMDPQFVFPKIFVVAIEWILCQANVIDNLIESISRFATDDGFELVRLPHSQLFPQPAPSTPTTTLVFDELPFHQKISLQLPVPVSVMCYTFLVSRMIQKLNLLLIFASREFSHPEGFSTAHQGGGQMMVFSRHPGWILMERSGQFFISITATTVEWIPSRFASDNEHSSEASQSMFLQWKQIVHTSIVDSTSKT